MILFLLNTAIAQESTLTPEGAACSEAAPIAGSAGMRNASEAIQLNANTYSASAFTSRHLVGLREGAHVVVDLNTTYGATHLPVFHEKSATEPDECLPGYRVAMRPLDLSSANMGFAWSGDRGSLIVATSMTWAAPAFGDQLTRVLYTSAVAPAYMLALSTTAPLVDTLSPGPMDFSTQSTAVTLDWLLGATMNLENIDLATAWLGSKGGYGLIRERRIGAYAFGAVSQGTPVLRAGIDRAMIGPAMTTAEYLDLPDYQAPIDSGSRLRVGHLRQDNLGGAFDLGARYRFAPTPQVSELVAAVHSDSFHLARDETPGTGATFLLQGGYVTTPVSWAMGVGPATLPSARVIVGYRNSDAEIRLSVYYNDPEQLQLYPFARGALSYQLFIRGRL